jgi:hypothetical protein
MGATSVWNQFSRGSGETSESKIYQLHQAGETARVRVNDLQKNASIAATHAITHEAWYRGRIIEANEI